jgi:hypothetical protein
MSEHARAVFRSWPLGVALALGESAEPLAAAVNIRVGSEFRVNTSTALSQQFPDVTINEVGDFVVVWESQGGGVAGIVRQRFDSAGQRQGGELKVNQSTSFSVTRPAIADIGSGFVVAWESNEQDGSSRGVFARLFDGGGSASSAEFQVNTHTSGAQYLAAISTDGFGDFVVAWQSSGQDGDSDGVFARRFTSSGVALAAEFQVNSYTSSHQRLPSVATKGDQGFVVVWHSYNQDHSSFGVFGRSFDSTGAALASEFQVNVTTTGNEFYPRVAIGPLNDFVVVWENFLDGDGRALFLRRFASSGSAVGGEHQVNSYTTNTQDLATLAIAGNGAFVVAWRSFGQDGGSSGIFGQSFDFLANRTGPEFQINTRTESDQFAPRTAVDANGDLVVVWQSRLQDGDQYGVFAQRFTAAAFLDIDADGEIEALSDGLLALRWMFGFTGATLVTGAVDLTDCGRCDAQAIEDYLASIESALDLDDSSNVEVDALTDGLLILRWLFGFTGATLITGAVDVDNCLRCTASEIEAYLQSL